MLPYGEVVLERGWIRFVVTVSGAGDARMLERVRVDAERRRKLKPPARRLSLSPYAAVALLSMATMGAERSR